MFKLFFKFSLGSILSAAISLLTTPIITALLIPDEFGKASMYTLAFNLLLQVILVGTDQSFVRRFYQDQTDNYRSTLLFHSILAPVLFSILAGVLLFLFSSRISLLLVNKESNQFTLLLAASIIVGVFERFALLNIRMAKKAMSFSLIRFFFCHH